MKKYLTISAEILFWGLVTYFFCCNSTLRPSIPLHAEVISVLLIAISVYLDKFCFIPHFLLKRRHLWFILASITSVLAATTAEFSIAFPYIRKCFTFTADMSFTKAYFTMVYLYLFLRDAGFYGFFLLLFICHRYQLILNEERRAIAKDTNSIVISLYNNKLMTLNIDKIRYAKCDKNVTYIEMKNGQHYKQYCSLSYLEHSIPENKCLRINRNNLVLYDNISHYTTNMLFLHGLKEPFLFYGTKSGNILDKLLKWDASKFFLPSDENNLKNNGLAGLNLKSQDEFSENGGIDYVILEEKTANNNTSKHEEIVLHYIRKNGGCKTQQIADETKLSFRTVERIIQKLKDEDKIEYVGSKRYGGYFIRD